MWTNLAQWRERPSQFSDVTVHVWDCQFLAVRLDKASASLGFRDFANNSCAMLALNRT
jgi:hypothetical protein